MNTFRLLNRSKIIPPKGRINSAARERTLAMVPAMESEAPRFTAYIDIVVIKMLKLMLHRMLTVFIRKKGKFHMVLRTSASVLSLTLTHHAFTPMFQAAI